MSEIGLMSTSSSCVVIATEKVLPQMPIRRVLLPAAKDTLRVLPRSLVKVKVKGVWVFTSAEHTT